MKGSVTTKIMGILNVTPDSFFDGGKHSHIDLAIAHGKKLYEEGADIIDVGGESTRPGAESVDEKEELHRVLPVIKALKKEISIPLSIDTMKAHVAEKAILAGASLINDVTGLRCSEMVAVAAAAQVPVIAMHMLENPKTMQTAPVYKEGVVKHLIRWFEERSKRLIKSGIKPNNLIFDPGIGFGKTVDDNYKILHNLRRFRGMGFPMLIGLSRKSLICKILNKPPQEVLAATIAMNTLAFLSRVEIIRVHDVAEHVDVREVITKYSGMKNDEFLSVNGPRS